MTGVANRVSEVKEGIYQRLTAGGITAFPGVARLVQQASRPWLLRSPNDAFSACAAEASSPPACALPFLGPTCEGQ